MQYILFEVPSNIIIKKISPSLWLASITVLWGISTVGMGLVKNVHGLIACRVLLGLFEAGIVPGITSYLGVKETQLTLIKGCVYLISMYYKRYEVQWRMSLFFSTSILAGAFSGLLAFAISKMHRFGGLEAWRWFVILRTSAVLLTKSEVQDLYPRRSPHCCHRCCCEMVDS